MPLAHCVRLSLPVLTRVMKIFGTILIAGASLLNGSAAEDAKPVATTNATKRSRNPPSRSGKTRFSWCGRSCITWRVGIEAMRREALLHSGEITTRAMQALTSRLSEWEAGRGMFRDVLDARRMLLESELMSARATAEEHQMLAEMLLWTGLENLEALTPLANESPLLPDHGDTEKKP